MIDVAQLTEDQIRNLLARPRTEEEEVTCTKYIWQQAAKIRDTWSPAQRELRGENAYSSPAELPVLRWKAHWNHCPMV